ncbi:hypothetical protein CMI38_04450 [Candidatus Pacearchaeota archaeon]|nr:hypothetical protein [Candidatus Pacearchaeota archaeon]
MANKFLDLKRTLKAADLRDKNFYDNMSEEDQKLYSPFLFMKYMASVKGPLWMQEHYVETINECVNKHLWTISKYKKLAWLLTSMCGVEQGQFHPWLGSKKKTGNNDKQKLLTQLYENMKLDDIETLAEINDKKELKELAKDFGQDDKQIKLR